MDTDIRGRYVAYRFCILQGGEKAEEVLREAGQVAGRIFLSNCLGLEYGQPTPHAEKEIAFYYLTISL